MKTSKYSIIIIDDHPIIHDGLKILLASEKDFSIDASATTASEAMALIKTTSPDLAIMDLSLSDSDGTYLTQRISSDFPRLRILVYSMSEEQLFGERVAIAGAHGYVMKTSESSILKKAIHTVMRGELFFSPKVMERILKKKKGKPAGSQTLLDLLSNREMDIFKLIGQGLDTMHIGTKLGIQRNTVDTHRINIKNKLELTNGKALDRLAYDVIAQGKLPKNL